MTMRLLTGEKQIARIPDEDNAYILKFEYRTAKGHLMLHEDHAAVILLNDMHPSELDKDSATISDMKSLVNYLETRGLKITDGESDFLLRNFGKLFGDTYLARLRDGVTFSREFPLHYIYPDGDFIDVLKARESYVWFEIFWKDNTVDVAIYTPLLGRPS